MQVPQAISDILDGASIDDAVDALINERVVCRYIGPPMKRTRKGRTYYIRARACTGQANPVVSRRASIGWKAGGSKQRAAISQRLKWRNFKPQPMRLRRLPGRRKR